MLQPAHCDDLAHLQLLCTTHPFISAPTGLPDCVASINQIMEEDYQRVIKLGGGGWQSKGTFRR